MSEHSPFLDLLDYRRRVAELYAWVRFTQLEPEARWGEFHRRREQLLREHPQSALDGAQKAAFLGLRYFPYNPALRYVLPVDTDVEPGVIEVELEEEGLTRLQRFGKISFDLSGQAVSLSLFWILEYGGGVFLPFRDSTNQTETYEGGRYLLDTIKGADLGQEGGNLVVDFNYAYNPSCAYNPRWHCPLAPPENRLPVEVRAGELRYPEVV